MPVINCIGGGAGGGGGAAGYPTYTYTGQSQLVDDDNGNWKLRLLTSGTLTFSDFGKGGGSVDIFLVGGGGGGGYGRNGGGGGYTDTLTGYVLTAEQGYPAVIGAGGTKSTSEHARAGDGGLTSFDTTYTVNGGQGGIDRQSVGSTGGSGGGVGSYTGQAGAGGSDGGNGTAGDSAGGIGQGFTTREFGEETGALYAGGGGGGGKTYAEGGSGGGGRGASSSMSVSALDGTANSGGGGGGGDNSNSYPAGDGGSGIVIIRNHRSAPVPPEPEEVYELINEVTTTEAVNNIRIDEDANGNPFALKKLFAHVITPAGFNNFLNFYISPLTDTNIGYISTDNVATYSNVFAELTPIDGGGGIVQAITSSGKNQGTSEYPRMSVKNGVTAAENISWFEARLYSYGELPAGFTVRVYGVRA